MLICGGLFVRYMLVSELRFIMLVLGSAVALVDNLVFFCFCVFYIYFCENTLHSERKKGVNRVLE